MNEFTFLSRHHHPDGDLVARSVHLAAVPCSPLYKRRVTPNDELRALISALNRTDRPTTHSLLARATPTTTESDGSQKGPE